MMGKRTWVVGILVVAVAAGAAYAAPTEKPGAGKAPQPPAATSAAARQQLPQDALLLVIDAFNVVRMLEDDEFAAKRDEIARNLLRNLIPFLCAQPSQGAKPPGVRPAQETAKPVPAAPKPKPKPQPRPKPSAAAGQAKPAAKPAAATTEAKGPASAYARVPQKKRIKRKFEAAREPFKKLQAENPEKAAVVGELLRAARAALARQQFDSAESYLDHALDMMGVPKPK